MKKRITSLVLSAFLVLGTVALAYGVERFIVPDMNFQGKAIELSLEQAIEQMKTTGSYAETAKLNKSSDEAVAKGYAESASSITDYFKDLDKMREAFGSVPISVTSAAEAAGLTEVNEKIIKMRRDFAKEQTDANFEAEMNQIEALTIETYYGVLQAEENLRIAKENLENQKTIYKNTLKKFELGTVAKVDTLMAETEVLTAENQVAAAETGVKSAKMNLNLLLGYDVMQEVVLTDELKMMEAPEGTLVEFIESAIENRNEIKGALLAAEIQEILLNNLKYRYPTNSSTYLKQQVAYNQAQKQADEAPAYIEMEIRMKYMDLQDKRRAVEGAKATLENAKEGYRLAAITYDAGMNTLADVQQALIRSYQAGQGLAKAINDYDLAVYAFNHAIGVGTTRLPL